MCYQDLIKEKTERMNEAIGRYLPPEVGEEGLLFEAMNYSVRAGGKRIRPLLLMETALMFSGEWEAAEPFAVALELIHTYSLVHDDLPAMDNDKYRRGQLTTHAKYGEAMGILAGDGLLNYAFEIMSDAVCKGSHESALAMRILAQKAGIYGMIAGQTVDLLATGQHTKREQLDYINLRKTSALLSAAMMAGGAVAGAGEEELRILENAGIYTGLAFQIKDDILDVVGDQGKLGKPLHSDEKNHKETYVSLLGPDLAQQEVLALSQKAVAELSKLPCLSPFLLEMILELSGRDR